MAYTPSLADLDEPDTGYQPSLSDLPPETPTLAGAAPGNGLPSMQDIVGNKLIFGMNLNPQTQPSSLADQIKMDAMGIGRGATEAGQGLKQLELEARERAGLVPPGTAAAYTKQKDLERQWYDANVQNTQNPYANILRQATSNPVVTAATAAVPESLLARLLYGSVAGGVQGATGYTPGGQDRTANAVKDAILGGTIATAPEIATVPVKLAKGAVSSVKSILPQTALRNAADQATAKAAADEADLQAAKAAAQSETGRASVPSMQYGQAQAQQSLAETPQIPAPPQTPDQAQQLADNAVANHEAAQQNLSNIDAQLDQHLNKGAAHDVRNAAAIDRRVGSIEDYWSQGYKNLDQKLKNARFEMPATTNGQTIEQQIAEKINAAKQAGKTITAQDLQDFARGEQQSPELADLLSKAPTSADTSASDFLAKYRSFRDGLYDLRQMAKGTRDAVERKRLFEEANKASDVEGVIKSTLQKGLGENAPEFERLNQGWSQEVIPLRQNPIVRAARKGKLSDNMVKQLRGNEPGTPLVREIIKQDPEALRNIVGQRYAAKPQEVHEPNEMMQEYINQMPELQKLLNQRKQAASNVQSAADMREQAAANVKTTTKQFQASQKSAQQRDELQQQLDLLDKHIANLTKQTARRDISLKEKVNAENDLAKVMKARDRTWGALKKIAVLGGAGYGLTKLGSIASGLMENSGEQ